MNKREKQLSFGFAALLVAFLVFGPVADIFGTANPYQREIKEAKRHLQSLKEDHLQALQELGEVESLGERSLPSDPELASVQYQEYLIRCLEGSGWDSPIITGASPIQLDGVGSKLQFTVQANATSAQVGAFLDQFFGTDLLHQINFLSIQQQGGANSPVHSVSAGIDVLVLDGNRDAVPILEPRTESFQAEAALAANDIFGCEKSYIDEKSVLTSFSENTSEENQTDPLSPIQPDPKETVRLIGVIQRDETWMAMFFDSESGKHVTLPPGSTLEFLGIEAKIISIRSNSIQILLGQSIQQLDLGNRIAN
jgi:hypothetical protein